MQRISPLAVKIVTDETGALLVTFANHQTSEIWIEPFSFGPTLNPVFKRSDYPDPKYALDIFQEVFAGATVNDHIPFEGKVEDHEFDLVQIKQMLNILTFDKCRRFFIGMLKCFFGQTVLFSHAFQGRAIDQRIPEFFRGPVRDGDTAAAHFA